MLCSSKAVGGAKKPEEVDMFVILGKLPDIFVGQCCTGDADAGG